MIIVSKDKTSLINMENTASMYIAAGDLSIKANMINGNTNVMKMGSYLSMAEAEKAFQMLLNEMRTRDICYLPTDEAVKAALANEKQEYHNIGGKKTKGYGGS